MLESLRKKIQPFAARLISSHGFRDLKRSAYEMKRRLLWQPHVVEVYLRINDPYSYLLVQVLASIELRFDVQIHWRTIQNLRPDMYPEMAMWHENAMLDAGHLAQLYALNWPEKTPKNSRLLLNQGSQQLLQLEAQWQNTAPQWPALEQIFNDYWYSKSPSSSDQSLDCEDPLARERRLYSNEMSLKEQGHYMSAMLHYAGEWYWGVDRLDHLEKRLIKLGLNKEDSAETYFNKTYGDFCSPATALTERDARVKKLTLYFSIRSPYSHIGLQQGIKLAEHYQCQFEIKPVLPMIMRGLSVPNNKKMYIFHDTKREADKLGLDYGFVADPLGRGVERCYSLFTYAKRLGVEREYLLNYAQAVNAQGIHSDTDKGLRFIVEASGMDWQKAKAILDDPMTQQAWQGWAEENREQMLALGSWGVPTFQYGDLVLWGQDRIGLIEKAIQADLAKAE